MKPRALQKTPAPKSQRINLLDLGSGDAKTLVRLSEKRTFPNKQGKTSLLHKKIIGIDLNPAIYSNRKNLKLLAGDALKKLKNIRPNSVNVVNADLLFNGIFKKQGGFEKAKQYTIELLREINRVLVPNGRFRIVEMSFWSKSLEELLHEAGFETKKGHFAFGEIEKPESTVSTRTRKLLEELRMTDDSWENYYPIKIFARKTK